MPALSNHRHELFAQGLARGLTASAAYEAAGYKPSRQSAYHLTTKSYIVARLAELQSLAAERTVVTAESLIREAEEVRAKAFADGQYAAAIAAIREKGVLAGVRVEKRESTHKTDPKEMTDDELALIASAGSAGVVAPPANKVITH